MVDCFDRIAVQMTEIALEPVKELRTRSLLSAVTIRTPSGGRRYHITIAKLFPAGERSAPVYTWSITEIDGQGREVADGITATCAETVHYGDPEDAYWAATDALAQATRALR
jgi:hypothetical protein